MVRKGPVTRNWFDEVIQVDDAGVFKVRQGLMWGLYDSAKDRFLVPVDCHSITEVEGGEKTIFSVLRGLKIGYYNLDGRTLFLSECDEVDCLDAERPWLIKTCKGKKWQICDLKKGKVISPPFDEIAILNGFVDNNTLFRVRKGEKFGIYDARNEEVAIPIQYDEIRDDDVARFKVCLGDKWGLFDTDLKALVIDLEFERISCVDGSDVYQVEKGGKTGFIRLPD